MLPLRVPSRQEVAKRVGQFRRDDQGKPLPEKLEALKRVVEAKEPPAERFEIHAVMLGSQWLLLAMPGELFADYEWLNRSGRNDLGAAASATGHRHRPIQTEQARFKGTVGALPLL